jgi:hypothetical protein
MLSTLKSRLLCGLSVAAVALAPTALSVAAVTIGTPDSGDCYPFTCNDSGTSSGQSIDYQQIYSSSAFAGPLTFKTITFLNPPLGGMTQVLSGTYDITLGTTSAGLGSNGPLPLSNVATFFDQTLSTTNVGATYTFSGTPYSYNPGSGNLVMTVVVMNQADVPNGSGNGYFGSDESGAVMSRTYALGAGGFIPGSTGLVTTFNIPEASTWAMMLIGFAGLGFVGYRRTRMAKPVKPQGVMAVTS